VKEGESLEVTEHGHPVAVLAPLREPQSAFDRMLAEGRIRPAVGTIDDIPLPPGPVSYGGTEALAADREGKE
jgi:antitoxin (DNA-binding transcriptional repressor) of toxin-antitoxin stability system